MDTSLRALALRRDSTAQGPEVRRLREALGGGETVHTTGLVLQELLQGFRGPRPRIQIIERFSALAMIIPAREDHIAAADIRNDCRRHGIQTGTIDALLAEICIRHGLVMLSTNPDFRHMAARTKLVVWSAP